MIYLIRSAAFKDRNDSGCTEYEAIYKIGFTGEDSKKSRLDIYITENPTSQTLFLIPGGTEQDEKNLHLHFKKYKKDYGREWFSEEPEILDFFKTHTTKESLKELNVKLPRNEIPKRTKEIEINFITPVLRYEVKENPSTYMLVEKKLYELLETTLRFLNQQKLEEYFKKNYPDVDFSTPNKEPPDNIKPLVTKFYEYNNTTDRIKFVVSQKELLSEVDFGLLLDNVSAQVGNYITLLGIERIKAQSCQMSRIVKYIEDNIITKESKKNIMESIYKTFIVGERYTKAHIKNKLRDIYKLYGYGKTPKAIDLWEYFELKSCQITNKSTGKLDNGYRILKIKTP